MLVSRGSKRNGVMPYTYPGDYPDSRPAPICGMCFDRGYVYVGDWREENRVECPLRCRMRLVTYPEPGTVIGGLED